MNAPIPAPTAPAQPLSMLISAATTEGYVHDTNIFGQNPVPLKAFLSSWVLLARCNPFGLGAPGYGRAMSSRRIMEDHMLKSLAMLTGAPPDIVVSEARHFCGKPVPRAGGGARGTSTRRFTGGC